MKARCYYCNKELTERTIKRHMKNCAEMKECIDRELKQSKSRRKQYILAIKDEYSKKYCIYISIDAALQLCHLDQFIRDVWVECCGHLSEFTIDGDNYHDNRDGNYEMNVRLNEVLYIGQKFEYVYDFGSSTYLTLEVIDEIDVSKKHSQIEIIARNNEEGRPNSPREGECGYVCDEEAENTYLPGNSAKYKASSKKPQTGVNDLYDNLDNVLGNMDEDELEQQLSDYHENMQNELKKALEEYFNGLYSFDIKEIINSYKKNEMIDLAYGLNIVIPAKLKKKDFAEVLINEYEKAAESVVGRLNKDRYKLLNDGMKNNGIIKSKEDRVDFEFSIYNSGIIFPSNDNGMCLFVIPKVVQDILKRNNTINFRRKIKENTEIVKIVSGMLYTYGIVKCSDIENTLRNMGYHFEDIYEVLNIFEENKRTDILPNYIVEDSNEEPEFLVNGNIDEYQTVLNLIDENMTKQKFSKEKLMMMGNDNYLQHSNLGENFKDNLLTLFSMSKEDAEQYTNMMALDVQHRSSQEIIDDVLNGIDTELTNDDQRIVRNVIYEFIKNIPIWRLGGFSLNEVEKQEAKNKVKHNGSDKVIELFPSSKRK